MIFLKLIISKNQTVFLKLNISKNKMMFQKLIISKKTRKHENTISFDIIHFKVDYVDENVKYYKTYLTSRSEVKYVVYIFHFRRHSHLSRT